jgi:predicted Zn-dependent protease
MSSREDELRAELDSKDESVALKAGLELAHEILIPQSNFLEAETTLLEVIGLQSHSDGFIVQLRLAELYIKMNEFSRAKRFLNIASTSNQDLVKRKADELLINIED